jgi:hypothetical protein
MAEKLTQPDRDGVVAASPWCPTSLGAERVVIRLWIENAYVVHRQSYNEAEDMYAFFWGNYFRWETNGERGQKTALTDAWAVFVKRSTRLIEEHAGRRLN